MDSQPLSGPADGDPALEFLTVEPLLTRDFDVRPSEVYARLRRRYGQVAPVDLAGVPVWLVLGYAEVRAVLQNEALWKRDIRHWRARTEGRLPLDWPLLAGQELRHTMFLDGREHHAARRTLDAALRPYRDSGTPHARRLRSVVRHRTDELIAMLTKAEDGTGGEGPRTGRADLCAQFSRPLALLVIDHLYGLPTDLGDDVVVDIWRMLDGGRDAADAVERVSAAMTALVAAKRHEPGDDLVSRMLAAAPSLPPERLGRELFMIAVFLSDVTSNLISNTALEIILGTGGVRGSLSVGLLSETVNRAALANPPVANLTFRFPARDVRMGDFLLRAGDTVVPSVAAAHRDPVFCHAIVPDTLVSTRAHLAWGAGPHQCPGPAQELAMLIVTTAVGRLFERFATLDLTVAPDRLPWRSAHIIRGLRSLPVWYETRDTPAAITPRFARTPGIQGVPEALAAPVRRERRRSALWRLLAGLRRGD